MMKFKKKTLPNGLRMIAVPMPDNPTVTVLVLVEAGSKYETKEKNGISHFLEHMCFKGTTNRPKTSDISIELDGLGCLNNAFTSEEFTGYFAKGKKKDFARIMDIVSDLYLNPLLKEDEMEKEKGVIVDEINLYEDLPMRKVQYVWHELLYGDQPAGWGVLGKRDIITSMKREDFLTYRNAHYVANATTVVVAGNITPAEVFKEVSKKFKTISGGKKTGKKKTVDTQASPRVSVFHKETDQSHLVLGVRTLPVNDERNYTLSVLAAILGSGMSSRLFVKIRDEMGVGYYVHASNTPYTDHGYLSVDAGVANHRAEEVVKAILNEFKKLKTELVSKEELGKVKEHLVGMMYLGLESSDSLAEYCGIQEVLRREIKAPKEKERLIRAVTAEQVRTMARKIFIDKNLNLALIGPFKGKDVFQRILKIS